MGQSLENSLNHTDRNSLIPRTSRAAKVLKIIECTEHAKEALRVRREMRALERVFDDLEKAVTRFQDGVTVDDDRRIELMLQVAKGLDQQRERMADLLGRTKRPGAQVKQGRNTTLKPVLDASQLLPDAPIPPAE